MAKEEIRTKTDKYEFSCQLGGKVLLAIQEHFKAEDGSVRAQDFIDVLFIISVLITRTVTRMTRTVTRMRNLDMPEENLPELYDLRRLHTMIEEYLMQETYEERR